MKCTRREFLGKSTKLAASGLLGTAILGCESGTVPTESQEEIDYSALPPVTMRTLGRTGLDVSSISLGTVGTNENTIRYGIKNGINFIHTSPEYSGGRSMREVAKAIKGQRDKVFLGLKVIWNWDRDDELHKSLKVLGTDYVDIAFFNIHNDPKLVASRKVKSTFAKWKKQGYARFLGLTTHGGMKECMEAALETNWYDCLMPTYQIHQRKHYRDLLKKCEENNIGIIAMKTKINPSKSDLVPVFLRDRPITTLCRTMTSLREVAVYIHATTKQISSEESLTIMRRESLASVGRCVMCGACTLNCPDGLAVSDVVRCVDYYVDTMGDYHIGKENYLAIGSQTAFNNCDRCGVCEDLCPNNVPIRNYVKRSKEMFC